MAHPKILDTIEILPNLEYHLFDGTTGINVSGGADSAILLYLTMKYSKSKLNILTLGNNQRYRRNVQAATAVIERCIQLTGNDNIIHHIHYTDVQSVDEIIKMIDYHRDQNEIDVMLGGMTQNPPEYVTDTFELDVTEDSRSPDTIRDPIIKLDSGKIVGFLPFVNLNKKVIAELYEKYDLMESLFPLTRSCEFDPTSGFFHGRKIVDPGMGHCGRCWWCQERKWAFGRL